MTTKETVVLASGTAGLLALGTALMVATAPNSAVVGLGTIELTGAPAVLISVASHTITTVVKFALTLAL